MFELSVAEWLESDYLRRVAARVANTYHLASDDLFQELRLALWEAGQSRVVNATWVIHTANHLAVDLMKKRSERQPWRVAVVNEGSPPLSRDHELALLVHARAGRLPEVLRGFYRLRFEEGFTQREIMQLKRLSRGSVRGMERRCLRLLTGHQK